MPPRLEPVAAIPVASALLVVKYEGIMAIAGRKRQPDPMPVHMLYPWLASMSCGLAVSRIEYS